MSMASRKILFVLHAIVLAEAEVWTEVTSIGSTKSWRSITSSADGTKLAAVVKGGNIWTSSDSGETWTNETFISPTQDWQSIASNSDGSRLAAVVNDGKIWTLARHVD